MKNMIIGLLVLVSVTVNGATVNAKFLHALNMVETGGRVGAIKGDGGKALGPFQIHKVYFLDASQFDKSLGNDYSKCADLKFSERVVTAYLNRYAKKAVVNNDFEVLSRIHNGGPKGNKKTATVKYWNKVKKQLQ